jgi:putative SOS response-associated peptidase YedK
MSRVADAHSDAERGASSASGRRAAPGYPSNRTSHAERIGEPGAVIRYGHDGLEMVNLRWGFALEPSGRLGAALRSEGRSFPTNRCLVPASEVYLPFEGRRYRVSLVDGDWFYLAGLWRQASRTWPASYAVLTVEAGADVRPLRERQNAVILRKDRMAWLEGGDETLLRPLPKGTFRVERADSDPRQGLLI